MTNPLLAEEGLPRFSQIRPDDVEPALDETLRHNREELEQLLASDTQPDFANSILALEEMHDRLHRAWAPVSHLQMVRTSDELREVYDRCLPKLARYGTEVAQNPRLFQLYKTVSENLGAATDSPEGKLLEHALRDFRLAGVDLPDEEKKQFKEVMEELSQVQAAFEHNLLDAMSAWSQHETDPDRLTGIPDAALDAARANAAELGQEGWLLKLDQPTYVAVISHADNEELRQTFYTAWVTRASDQGPNAGEFDNTELMETIMRLRHSAANLVGFDNFADYALASRMAGSVAEVTEFLEHLATVARPVAGNEFDELQDWAGKSLNPWDMAYYAEKLRLENFSVSDEELRPYFPLNRVMDGLFQVMQKLYGLTAREEQDIDNWQTDVRYYTLVNANDEEIGGFFMDLYARSNKRSGAWMDECVLRKCSGTGVQNPVAHLVCNFTQPAEGKPALLTHSDIVTLFHEFGHTLHHLLTRIDYPSVSGINGVPWDAVELPSQFMENFAWDPDVVRNMSSHIDTGEPLSDDLLNKLEASRVFHSGLQMMRQIEFALLDLRIHAEYDPAKGARIRNTLGELRERFAVTKTPEFSRFENSFAHVFGGGYAAGYYSYKWAEVLAADAFAAFQESGLFDRSVADRFRKTILEVGGTRDIGAAFQEFRGRPPKIEPLLEQAGIIGETDS